MDTAVGLLAGLVTFPVVMTFGLKDAVSSSTVGALFIALPTGLAQMGISGRVVAIFFFLLAYIAAITSSISLLEVPVSSMMEKFGLRRNQAVWISTGLVFVIGIPSALNLDFLGKMDAIFGGILLILGGLCISLLLGWVVPRRFENDLIGCETPSRVIIFLKFMLRWISPPVIAFGLVVSMVDLFRQWALA